MAARMEMLRVLARWLVLVGAVLLAFLGTVTLNLTVYSASGFVSSYLDAVARRDVRRLRMPGSLPARPELDELRRPLTPSRTSTW
jgi:hypothetical protein